MLALQQDSAHKMEFVEFPRRKDTLLSSLIRGDPDDMDDVICAEPNSPESNFDDISDNGDKTDDHLRSEDTHSGDILRSLRQSINRRPVVSLDRVRHKRQTLQDMARPLKHWLYKHRDNPYPTKSEKMTLANVSHMTLTQVSNWFANARRRLKNTVRDPELNWESRIKMYNSCVEGNQELLSIDSDDDEEEMKAPPQPTEAEAVASEEEAATPLDLSDHTVPGEAIPSPAPSPPMHTDEAPHPPKYKQCILQRYLTDSYQHAAQMQNEFPRQRNASGSLSSHDYEEISTSFAGSPLREHQFDARNGRGAPSKSGEREG